MIIKDVKYGVASLARTPAFSLTALVVLALGIGANTAIFSVAHGVLLRPLPFEDPDRLIRIWSNREDRNLPFFSVSVPDYLEWRARGRSIERLAAYERPRQLTTGSDAEQVSATRVSVDLFPLLGVVPALGRGFAAEDAAATRGPVTVISHGLWQRRFGGRSDVLGRTLALDNRSWTVIGVMPPRFEIPNAASDVWLPFRETTDGTERSLRFLRVLGRVRPGQRPEDARRELAQIAAQLGTEYPASNLNWSVSVRPLVDTVVSPEFRRSVVLLAGAVAFVLLMACANVTALLLSRATTRRREMAVRTALGASRAALVRLWLVESLVLAAAAGIVGVVLAIWGIDALKALGGESIPRLDEVALSLPVLTFAGVVTLLTAGLFGVVPAVHASSGVAEALRSRESSADARASRSRSALIVAEVALAVVLLVGAGLMIRSFARLQQRALGFDATALLIAQVAAPSNPGDQSDLTPVIDELVSSVATLPGVVAAAGGSSLPFAGPNAGNVFHIEGKAVPGEQAPDTDYRVVTPGYFRTLGISLVSGRSFTDGDGPDRPAVVISLSAAQRYWPDGDAIGARVRLGDSPWMTIVGVASDVRYSGIDEPGDALRPMMYVPHRQMPGVALMLGLKTATSPEAMADTVRATLRAAAPSSVVTRIQTMTEILTLARGSHRFAMTLLSVFAWVAVILAAAGLYGLIAYVVSRRTKEIGVRVALGANAVDIVRVTAGRGLVLGAIGVVLGVLASLGLSQLLRRGLFEVSATDPATYMVVAGSFLILTAAASYVPARRALRINPVDALRAE